MSHSGAWQVSAKTLIRDTDRSRLRFRDSCERDVRIVGVHEQMKRAERMRVSELSIV